MIRRLLNLLTALSLLLCVAVSVLWVRRHPAADVFGIWFPHHACSIISGADAVRIDYRYGREAWRDESFFRRYRVGPSRMVPPDTFWHRQGFQFIVFSDRTRARLILAAPHWAAASGFAVLPILQTGRRVRRRRRRAAGRCTACGYDLTGNVSGVCPECGGANRTTAR